MSRIARAVIRRDRAWHFMAELEKDEASAGLNVEGRLTELFKDIPSEKISVVPANFRNKNYEWHAICIGARIASISGIWDVPVDGIETYLPSIDHETFKAKWENYRKSDSKNALDFLKLLRLSTV